MGICYTLNVEGEIVTETVALLDALLRKNPHYDWCRDLGQLDAPRAFLIKTNGFETFIARECVNGKRVEDVKPIFLSLWSGWSKHFSGDYV